MTPEILRGWEYARAGDYHRNLDPNWSYTPTYLRKMAFVREFVGSLSDDVKILDVGCGEGVLVEEFRRKGREIEGIDLNYESKLVQRGDARQLPYPDSSFNVVLFLDTLEHLSFEDQPKALSEIYRVLNPGSDLLMSVPNLAHLNSRVRFLLRGCLDRTDIETNHIGERPIHEYERLLEQQGFVIIDEVGITLTLSFVYRRIICRSPARFRWLHDALEPLARLFPTVAMLTIFSCKKGKKPSVHGK